MLYRKGRFLMQTIKDIYRSALIWVEDHPKWVFWIAVIGWLLHIVH